MRQDLQDLRVRVDHQDRLVQVAQVDHPGPLVLIYRGLADLLGRQALVGQLVLSHFNLLKTPQYFLMLL